MMLALKTYVPLLSFTTSHARGIVLTFIIQKPHEEPPQLPNQSAQSGSCSPPMISVPPCGTTSEELDDAPAPVVDFLSLLHAATSRTDVNSRQKSLTPRRCFLTNADLLV